MSYRSSWLHNARSYNIASTFVMQQTVEEYRSRGSRNASSVHQMLAHVGAKRDHAVEAKPDHAVEAKRARSTDLRTSKPINAYHLQIAIA